MGDIMVKVNKPNKPNKSDKSYKSNKIYKIVERIYYRAFFWTAGR